MDDRLRLVLETPRGVAFDDQVRAVRVPTETGQVGLRPRGEPLVLVVEPGLVVLGPAGAPRFAATAGGLLEMDRARATLYTPFAVTGTADEVLAALDRALRTPESELAARRRLDALEQRIVEELRPSGRRPPRRTGPGD